MVLVLAYLFILSRIPGGYTQVARTSRHCLQTGVSPLHLVFLTRQDSHARGTRLLCFGATFERWRGMAIFACGAGGGGLTPSEAASALVAGASFDIVLMFG